MSYLPLLQAFERQLLTNIRLIATDMDGTITKQGKLSSDLVRTLEDLEANGVIVLIITGRSAGWVSGLSSLLPIGGAICENGGLFYPSNGSHPLPLTPIPHIATHRRQLAATFARLQAEFPQIQESSDNPFRLTDWTFDVAGLTTEDLDCLSRLCASDGWGFTFSSVQCHIKPINQDKATGLLQMLAANWNDFTPHQVLTIGDSPNDDTLFDRDKFPLSVGVANILDYQSKLSYPPAYITNAPEADGFCELARYILNQHFLP
ncbi:HAD hydrolase family protein [[Phormidium] sp. ETS-05]|uniref:HAD hydrolase family protein n=1 Tax=[Phormidium] sp. ETS-05 TaxID=222819 RepID=UPI0018EED704|nr:HAD family hydrolase [[Phormidium] sp. ETS-05]